MGFNLLAAVGLVYRDDGSGAHAGSCFLFRRDDVAITAGHCAPGPGQSASVMMGVQREARRVIGVAHHPGADLALLRLAPWAEDHLGKVASPYNRGLALQYAFWNLGSGGQMGSMVGSFGYPFVSDALGYDDGPHPVARTMLGHVQRTYPGRFYRSRPKMLELSFSAPLGLSGGPVFMMEQQDFVVGVVIGNHETVAESETYERTTVEGVGGTTTTRAVRVISYGAALALEPLEDWLTDHIGPPGQSAETELAEWWA